MSIIVPCGDSQAAPSQVFPRRLEQACNGGLATLRNLSQHIGAEQVHHCEDQICRERVG
jgi:hypothetical protein